MRFSERFRSFRPRTRVGIIGAGPGGLAAAVLLRKQGFEVDLFEASPQIGGRNGVVELGPYRFDLGPTFLLMPSVLEEIFRSCDRNLKDYLELKRIDPLYSLRYPDGTQLNPSSDVRKMVEEVARLSPRDAAQIVPFRERQRAKFEALLPALRRPFAGWTDLVDRENLPALPFLNLKSVYDELASYFEDERVRLAFTFQAKYLGMSPFECPSLFSILAHIEHELGVWHPVGGVHQVSHALAKLFEDLGGSLHLNEPVLKCRTENGRVVGFDTASGSHNYDYCVMNADFGHGISELFSNQERKKYRDDKLQSLKYSCSTFMMYLGIEGELEWPHHSIWFAQNYRKNVRELCDTLELSKDPSFYLHNPSRLDPTLAPAGHSALYVLVPVPNLDAAIDWETEAPHYRDLVLKKIQERTGVDLAPRIRQERVITPREWNREFRIYKGATFSMAHSFDQMIHFRPHNEFEEFRNFYLVGGGTHPGSGLPTILESGRIAAELIRKRADTPLRQVWGSMQNVVQSLGNAMSARPSLEQPADRSTEP